MTWRLLAAVCLLGSMGCAAAPVDGPTGTVFDAIRAGLLPRLQQLISAQPEVLTERNDQGATALMFAAYLERAELVGALRAAKKELDFFEACIVGDLPLLRAHLARAQEVNLRSPDGFTPLGLAIFFGRPDAARLLMFGAHITARSEEGKSAAGLARLRGHRDLAQRLELVDGGSRR
jgi:uncharacterized protein